MDTEPFYLSRPLVIAHRGASASAPENTLAAFQAASDQGADGIELDVTRCATGQVVVMHDATVDRTTDGSGRVVDLPLGRLREFDAGSWYGPTFAGERVPLLEEVLELASGRIRVNIEIKGEGSGQGLEERVAGLVERHGLARQVLISSFSKAALRRMRVAAPDLPRALLYATPTPLSLLSWTLARPRLDALHPHFRVVSVRYVEGIHRRGMRINVWTVNDTQDMADMAAYGVDGIITDHPAELLRLLAKRES